MYYKAGPITSILKDNSIKNMWHAMHCAGGSDILGDNDNKWLI